MKALCLITPFLLLIGLNACKKESTNNTSQGTTYNHLLKTVAKFSPTNQIVTSYSYDANNRLAEIKIISSATDQYTEKFFRDGSGKLDSIVAGGSSDGIVSNSVSSFFYDAGGKLNLSFSRFHSSGSQDRKDSSVYLYTGNLLQKRTDYRSFDGGNTYNLLTEVSFEFDAAGNVTRSVFDWAVSPNTTDTLIFQYDNKPNPVPRADGYFYWAPVFYNDYKMQNNLLKISSNNTNQRSVYEYGYAPNNKPLYRKQTDPADFVYETVYYYD